VSRSRRRIVIIGTGIAGYSAAQTIKKSGMPVALTLLSREDVPPYSACVLSEYIACEIGREQVFLRGRDHIPFQGSEVRLGRHVVGLDLETRTVILDTGATVGYESLILAVGSRPVLPRIPGVDKAGVYSLKSLADAEAIMRAQGKEAVVVGSGPVGLEVAVALHKRGWRVRLIELMERILPRLFAAPQSEALQAILEEKGIEVRTGERVTEIVGKDSVEGVVTDRRTLPCQLVVLVVGMRPETGLARGVGLRLGHTGGIVVDVCMRTSHDHVFACGDCVETIDCVTGEVGLNMLWGNARQQGIVAGLNSVGITKRYGGALNITTLNVFGIMGTSVGKVMLEDETYHEIVTTHGQHHSTRLVVREGLIRGIQAVGPSIDISVFLHMMRGAQRLRLLSGSRETYAVAKHRPWVARLPVYMRG